MTCQAQLSPCPWEGRWWSPPPPPLDPRTQSFWELFSLPSASTAPSPCCPLREVGSEEFQKVRRSLISLKTRLPLVSDSSLCSQGALHTIWLSQHSLGVAGSMARFTVNTDEVQFPKHPLGPRSCHSIATTVQITRSKAPLWVFFSQPEWRSPVQKFLRGSSASLGFCPPGTQGNALKKKWIKVLDYSFCSQAQGLS